MDQPNSLKDVGAFMAKLVVDTETVASCFHKFGFNEDQIKEVSMLVSSLMYSADIAEHVMGDRIDDEMRQQSEAFQLANAIMIGVTIGSMGFVIPAFITKQ